MSIYKASMHHNMLSKSRQILPMAVYTLPPPHKKANDFDQMIYYFQHFSNDFYIIFPES